MTIKEAIIKSLEDLDKLANSIEICEHILANSYYEFAGKTPPATVSAQLGDFIRNGDTRVKRIKQEGGTYSYYLTKNEQNIGIEILSGDNEAQIAKPTKINKSKTYEERDLHKLLSSYLKNTDTYSKTIFTNNQTEKTTTKFGHIQIWLELSF
jgi:hypothetical protein